MVEEKHHIVYIRVHRDHFVNNWSGVIAHFRNKNH